MLGSWQKNVKFAYAILRLRLFASDSSVKLPLYWNFIATIMDEI